MKIFVKANPRAHEERIDKIDDTHFIVSVKEPPVQGRANAAIIRAMAEYFKVAPARLRLVSGFSSREKLFELL